MSRKGKAIVTKDITKVYQMGQVQVHALRGVSLQVKHGEIVSIMGPSGSGKSTLMNIIGCLDRPTSGDYLLDNKLVSNLTDNQLAAIRNQKIGFVFQNYNLLARSSALINVELPMRYGEAIANRREKAVEVLEAVGLQDRMDHKPMELSGGQQQRVALARALVNNPTIILADEPTGNLDSNSGTEILELLLKLNKDYGTTLIIVTHDPNIASQTERIIKLHDGQVVEKKKR